MPAELRVEFRQDMDHEIDRLTGIINDLLTLTKMDSHADVYKRQGVKSPNSLYMEEIATFGDSHDLYSHKDSEGFINLLGLPLKVKAMVDQKNK